MKKYYFIISLFLFSIRSIGQDLEAIDSVKAVEFSGSVTLFGSMYNANGIDPRRKDFSWFLSGAPMLKLYGVEIPFSFIVSEQERDFRQPFNQFGIAPKYKWIQGYFGYSNIQWSPFTWGGQTILGAGVELNPKKMRFGFLYGRLNRAVEESENALEIQTPAFKRTGFASKIGYGTPTSFVDLIFLKGKDEISSLNEVPKNSEVLPGENVVVGVTSKLKLSQRLYWDFDFASSIYTRDIRSSYEDSDDLIFLDRFKSLITVNSSTQLFNSMQSEFRLDFENYKIKARYRRIEPDYQSMGAYFFQTDVENITLEPTVLLWKNKLRFSSSVGHQRDNILNKRSYTTNRWIGSGAIDCNFNQVFGILLNYANYSTDQTKGLKIPTQATQQTFVNQNMMIMPRFTFVKEKITHLHTLMFNKQWMIDKNPNTSQYTEYEVNNYNYNTNFIFNSSGLNLGATAMKSEFKNELSTTDLISVGINASKMFWKNKMTTSFSVNGTNQKLNEEDFAKILNINFQNVFRLDRHHGITINGVYLKSDSKHQNGIDFNEYNIDLGYTYTF